MKSYFLKFLVLIWVVIPVFAQSSGSKLSGSSKRPWLLSNVSDATDAKRFTLAEWFEQKNRSSMADMWLGYNSPSPYEYMFGVNFNQYDYTQKIAGVSTSSTAYKSYQGDFSAYVRNVGLTVQYHQNTEEKFDDTTGIFNFRLLGTSLQNSHLTLHYGLRTRVSSANNYRMNHQFPAATLQLYLVQNFGIYSHYRKYLKSFESVNGDTEGDELIAGVFIEFGRLRLSGNYFEENQNSILNTINNDINRKGTRIGLQIHF